MEQAIPVGSKGVAEEVVSQELLATSLKSGNVNVYATPAMIALVEQASVNCLQGFLKEGETSVGTLVNVSHLAATPKGMKVRAEAVVKEVNGKKIIFDVVAFDEKEKIGEGTHHRFILNAERFQSKANQKLNQ